MLNVSSNVFATQVTIDPFKGWYIFNETVAKSLTNSPHSGSPFEYNRTPPLP